MKIKDIIFYCWVFLFGLTFLIPLFGLFVDLIWNWRKHFFSSKKLDNIVNICIFIFLAVLFILLVRW